LNSNTSLISIGNFDLKLHHLLIIAVLSLSFSISFLIRAQPADFGWELNEFDPFFNYRATQYIVDNGINSYFEWNDDLSWYPHGRDVSATSQIMLHITAATTYWIFGAGGSLYDFTILFPVIFGSLTSIVIFALVRVIGGTTAGLFSALLFSVSLPIIVRGQIGWFKSEPLGLFFGFFSLYLLLSGIKSNNYKIVISKLVGAGILLGFSFASWGGTQFFVIPIGLFMISLPFLRNDNKFLLWTLPLFSLFTILTAISFERPGIGFLTSMGGMGLIVPTIIMVFLLVIKIFSKTHVTRNMLLFLLAIFLVTVSVFLLGSEFLPSASFRYLNALNPFLTTTDPLVDSVSEHATTTISQSFLFHSILMIFAGLGIWLILKNTRKFNFIKNDMLSFSLFIGLTGVYISSTFVRLEVFASLSVIILASLGLSILLRELFSNKTETRKLNFFIIKVSFVVGLIFLLIIPVTFPTDGNIFTITKNPPTILNGGSTFPISTTDWLDSMEWIKNNTHEDAVIGAWWDYGYWIQTKADRASLADNSTLIDWVIKKIATIFISSPDEGWQILRDMDADYFLIFVAGQRLAVDNGEQPLYVLSGGGDESKKQWFMRIAEVSLPKYLHSDGISGTDYFWNETLLGKMIPFTPIVYMHFPTNQQSSVYQNGFTPIYTKDIKLPMVGDGPLQLVYSSPSFDVSKGESMVGVFIYKINKDYVPLN
jgi:dolichyl-diphosphooligosaccharide--protein glycosyltransferase